MKYLAMVAVLVAATALAPSAGRTAEPPMPKGMVMMTVLQTRPDQVGDVYSYVADTREHTEHDGKAQDGGDRQTFKIEVLKVRPDGLTLRYTQLVGEDLGPEGQAKPDPTLVAFDGVPIDFETSPNGYPTRMTDEAGVKAAISAAFARGNPDQAAKFKGYVDSIPSNVFMERAVGDKLIMIAAMQLRGPVQFGHQQLPDERAPPDADGVPVTVHKTTDVLPAEGACRVKIVRKTWSERPTTVKDRFSSLETEAVLAEGDGWVLTLTEVSKIVVPGGQQTKTTTIKRNADHVCPKG